MPMEIHLVNTLCEPELSKYLHTRIMGAIGSLQHQLDYIEVELRDDPATKSGPRVCDIDMKLFPRGWIYVNARSDDFRNAIDLAVQRAHAVVQKTIAMDD
ncbi:hypothetical protein [Rosistilla carotiformis]|nr:hypothetical protein [Rosistilla carotiformis]